MQAVDFFYSKQRARLMVITAPMAAILCVGLIALGLLVLSDLTGIVNVMGGVAMLYAGGRGILSLIGLWGSAHCLWMRYVVTSQGITIEADSGSRTLPWLDFEGGEYRPLSDSIVLYSHQLDKPVVLDFGARSTLVTKGPRARNDRAKLMIESAMGGKIKRRWIP